MVHFGTTIGAWLKKKIPFDFTPDLYIGAGVAASISSGFGAPLAGLIFAHGYTSSLFTQIYIGNCYCFEVSRTGYQALFGAIRISSPSHPMILTFLILLVSFIAGPVFGFVSILYMRSLLFKISRSIKGK